MQYSNLTNIAGSVRSRLPGIMSHMGGWWAGRSRLAQVGYLGGAAWLAAYGASRVGRAVTTRRPWMGQPPPSNFRAAPTAGLVQAQHERRTGHRRMGPARSRDHMSTLYGR